MVIGLPSDGLTPAWERDFSMFPPGGVILFARDFRDLDDLRRLILRLRKLARPRRLFISLDEEGGWVSQLAGHLVVPPNAALLARGAEPGDLRYIAQVTARRLRALGFEWDFAPVADVHSEPDNPVIGPRAYGTTPSDTIAALQEVLRGFRGEGVASCLKHFPGHGDTRTDSHVAQPVCDADRATLEARELATFRGLLSQADSVMTAHVHYPALDAAQPGTYSRAIVQGLLREEVGFTGVCVTDALEMQGAAAGRTPAEAGIAALEAGCDLLLYAHWHENVRRARLEIADALVSERLERTAFDAARFRLAAFDAGRPEPSAEELAIPLELLTPPDWQARLARIIDRGLRVQGTLRAQEPSLWVDEPEWAGGGGTLAAELAAAGLGVGGANASTQVIVRASRLPLTQAELVELRQRCTERPTVLVGMQNDAFLAHLPQAVLRLSASDSTPLTRQRVAARLA
ncbi:MAG: glycoside hydrolase family 3 N-terminal domain-containing protein, partial [Candidatus Eisenbacteria bacterium]